MDELHWGYGATGAIQLKMRDATTGLPPVVHNGLVVSGNLQRAPT